MREAKARSRQEAQHKVNSTEQNNAANPNPPKDTKDQSC